MTDLDEYGVALRVATAFDELDIDYTLGGSLASSLHGEPRSTNDVDFAVRLQESQIPALIGRLGPEFVIDEEGLRAAVRAGRACQIAVVSSRARRAAPSARAAIATSRAHPSFPASHCPCYKLGAIRTSNFVLQT